MPDWVMRPVTWLVTAALLLLGLVVLLHELHAGFVARVEARLFGQQAGAAQASGRDASNTVGQAAQREGDSDALTRSNSQEIEHAEGANAPVARGVSDAGLRSLCRRAAYSRDPKCLQHADPR